jgi:tetratricopeptide (TPR) repeat protein
MAQRALAGSLIRQSKFAEARGAAARAVALDPVDHHALVALADAYAYGDKPADRDRARQEYRRALDIAPTYWYARFRYAVHLQNEGDLELSAEEADRAAALQPSAEYAYLTGSLSMLWLGRYDEARARLEAGMQQVPGSRLLKLTKALVAHATGDAASFALLRKDLQPAWPRGHVIASLLDGLALDLQGRGPAARAAFLGESRKAERTDWSGRPASDRRGASVNLYHMARALALRGDPAAREILDTAEKLNPGKAQVARKDPAFRAR